MPKANHLTALVKAHYDGSPERFTTLALQIAAHEAKLGHTVLASNLKKIVDAAKSQLKLKSISPELEGLLLRVEPEKRINNLVVPDRLRERIERVLFEYVNREKLRHFGLEHRRKLLLAGPPGTGKTLTASVIARELRLPLYVVLMDKMMNRYLGETTARLRQVFELIHDQAGVYLFDEFDAIGAERGKENEIGEMRKVLNGFLQFIEHHRSDSLIIAATNNINILDQALFRRFDDVLVYDLPEINQIKELVNNKLGTFRPKQSIDTIAKKALGISHAEIALCCIDAMKKAILEDQKTVDIDSLLLAIELRKESNPFYPNDTRTSERNRRQADRGS